jgi:hypothetical protein
MMGLLIRKEIVVLRLPHTRKSRIQLALVLLFLGAFGWVVVIVADYLQWIVVSVDLRDAISSGNLEAVKQFEREGVDWRDLGGFPDNFTALHQAAGQNNVELARYFVENGADVTAEMIDGNTPAGFAAMHQKLDALKYLLMETQEGEAMAQTDQTKMRIGEYADLELIEWFSTREDLRDFIQMKGAHRLLLIAVEAENILMVEYFLDIGTPDAMSSASWDEGFYRERSKPTDVAAWLAFYNVDNTETALHLAAQNGNEPIAKLLLNHGADLAVVDEQGKTAIDYAEENGHDAIVFLLKAPRPVDE